LVAAVDPAQAGALAVVVGDLLVRWEQEWVSV
jgi:hypothetical protein